MRFFDVDTDEESASLLKWLDIPRSETPVLVHATDVMRNPSAAQVARSLRLRAEVEGERFDLVVLGGGPAGLAAAVYGGSEGLRTFVAEAWAPGGQAGTSTRIENYLGFPSGISGAQLTRNATLQARRFDAVLSSFHRVVEIADGPEGLLRVDLDDGQHVLARFVPSDEPAHERRHDRTSASAQRDARRRSREARGTISTGREPGSRGHAIVAARWRRRHRATYRDGPYALIGSRARSGRFSDLLLLDVRRLRPAAEVGRLGRAADRRGWSAERGYLSDAELLEEEEAVGVSPVFREFAVLDP